MNLGTALLFTRRDASFRRKIAPFRSNSRVSETLGDGAISITDRCWGKRTLGASPGEYHGLEGKLKRVGPRYR